MSAEERHQVGSDMVKEQTGRWEHVGQTMAERPWHGPHGGGTAEGTGRGRESIGMYGL